MSGRGNGWKALARYCSAALLAAWSASVLATDIALVGLLPGRALMMIDGGKRQIVAVGATTAEGVKLVAIESGAAVFDIEGKRRRIQIGQTVISSPGAERRMISLTADARGHFVIPGSINGVPMRFLVDTGATLVALGAADAKRARIDTSTSTPGMSMTANGVVRVWKVKLSSVKLGDITLSNVDASVHEQDMPVVLLGMSVLNRMEIHRDGQSMVLTQRY